MSPLRPDQRAASILNGMSVDVEDYFHTEAMSKAAPRNTWDRTSCRVERNTEILFELFAAHNVRSTFFFLGWVAERYPALVRKARDLGHEIACHSYWHRPIYTLSPAEFREDTHRAKAVIEDAGGVRVEAYRAPSFSMTPGTEWAADILEEAGFTYDSSVHPVAHDLYDNRHAPRKPYRMAKTELVEIPISTIQLGKQRLPFCGGGYFRMLPFSYVCWGIRRLNRRDKQPAVFYIHPWEFDPEQPRLAASGRSRFRQYVGLSKTAKNLGRLCEQFRFAPMKEAFSEQLDVIQRTGESVDTAV
jgi:polysaccharide deacetylase family protein (PEP-CTERM system associated)